MKKSILISWLSVAANILLAGGKLLAGIYGHSAALVADAVHSASDVLSTLVVIIGLHIARKPSDKQHRYGHGKYESLAALFLAIGLMYTGLRLGYNGITALAGGSYKSFVIPGISALIAAAVSIAVKEAMYHITIRVGRKERSQGLIADAWHHRSDALSSVGSLIGVGFARMGYPIADSIACIVISVFIVKSAFDIMKDSVDSLTDSACSPEDEETLRGIALAVPGVRGIDDLKTRRFGSGCYVDLEILVDGSLSLKHGHEIAEQVHDELESKAPYILHCMVHVNPDEK